MITAIKFWIAKALAEMIVFVAIIGGCFLLYAIIMAWAKWDVYRIRKALKKRGEL
jgi:hypothetical protein